MLDYVGFRDPQSYIGLGSYILKPIRCACHQKFLSIGRRDLCLLYESYQELQVTPKKLHMESRADKLQHFKSHECYDLLGLGCSVLGCIVSPIKLETGLRPNSAGIPYTLL